LLQRGLNTDILVIYYKYILFRKRRGVVSITIDKHISRAESVYQNIREKIIYDEYTSGTILREGELAAELDVSKTPVREALNGLKYEGLVEVIPYKGYIISQLSYQELQDLFELRIILETSAAELAIERMTKQQLVTFKNLATRKFDVDSQKARKQFMKVNVDFHSYLGEVSGNKPLADALRSTIQKLQRGLFLALRDSSLTKMEKEHLALVHAIENGNREKAKELIIKHAQESHLNLVNA